jgi:hypothetical protein
MKTLKLITKEEEKAANNYIFFFVGTIIVHLFQNGAIFAWNLLIGSNKNNHHVVTFFNNFNFLVSAVEAHDLYSSNFFRL